MKAMMGTKKGTAPARGGDLLAFKYAIFYTHDAHHRSPSVGDRSGRDKGGFRGRRAAYSPQVWRGSLLARCRVNRFLGVCLCPQACFVLAVSSRFTLQEALERAGTPHTLLP